MRNVSNFDNIKKGRNESGDAYRLKVLLCKLGKHLGFEVDVEEEQESELGKLAIRHDVLWYTRTPKWFKDLLKETLSRNDLDEDYKQLLETKIGLERCLYAAFEIEATDTTTKAMKGDISNLSKLPYGIIVVKRGAAEVHSGDEKGRKLEPIRNRFEKALLEFRKLHGPNNVIVVSFSDIERLCKLYNLE